MQTISPNVLLVARLGLLVATCQLACAGNPPWPIDGTGFPNPVVNQVDYNRHSGEPSYMCDPDNILKIEKSDKIQQILKDIKRVDDKCGHGYEMAVVVVENLEFPFRMSADTAIENFALSLHNEWGVGHKKCNSGILFAISKQDKKFFFSSGSGAKVISSAEISRMNSMITQLRKGDFGEGVLEAVRHVLKLLTPRPTSGSEVKSQTKQEPETPNSKYKSNWTEQTRRQDEGVGFIGALLIGMMALCCCAAAAPFRCPVCKKTMTSKDRECYPCCNTNGHIRCREEHVCLPNLPPPPIQPPAANQPEPIQSQSQVSEAVDDLIGGFSDSDADDDLIDDTVESSFSWTFISCDDDGDSWGDGSANSGCGGGW